MKKKKYIYIFMRLTKKKKAFHMTSSGGRSEERKEN